MQIVEKRLSELQPYENNPRKNDVAVPYVKESIKRYGFKVPLVIDENNVIVTGHTRYLASIELGLDTVPCIIADDLTDEQIKEFRLVDNKVTELATWDIDMLEIELEDIDFGGFDFGFDFGFDLDTGEEKENPYTIKTEIPQYEMTGEEPELNELYDNTKAEELQKEIENADIDESVKLFLKLATYRHTIFKYSKIAEYYAHAPKEVQELMEKSALVIIDFDNAIANGFAQLSERIEEMYYEDAR